MLEALHDAHADDEPFNGTVADEMTARALLIEYQRNDRRAGKLSETRDAVYAEYADRLSKLEDRQAAIKLMLHRFVSDHGKVSFPDVGTASLTQRKPTPKVIDPEAVVAWARTNAPQLVETSYTVPARDLAEHFKTTGELPDGVEVKTPDASLTIRKAAS